MLYALLLDRMELSRINHWVDEDGTIFLIFKREDLADMLGICTTTVWRAMKQLKEVGLIAEKRQGLNLPNLIYIGKIDYSIPEAEQEADHAAESPVPADIEILNDRTLKNAKSGDLQSKSQDVEKVNANKTERNKPDINNTELSDTESKKYKAEEKIYNGTDSS